MPLYFHKLESGYIGYNKSISNATLLLFKLFKSKDKTKTACQTNCKNPHTSLIFSSRLYRMYESIVK